MLRFGCRSVRQVKKRVVVARGASYAVPLTEDAGPILAEQPKASTSSQPPFASTSSPKVRQSISPSFFSDNSDPRTRILALKHYDLEDFLTRENVNSARVWDRYMALYEFVLTLLPLPSLLPSYIGTTTVQQPYIHYPLLKRVLRQCVPTVDQLRLATQNRIQHLTVSSMPHLYEVRLQTLIRHMYTLGFKPQMDDYHFVLEQFAAVGHHVGVKAVFNEIIRSGNMPTTQTYGLILQTCTHKLTMPTPYRFQRQVLEETTSLAYEMLDDMVQRGVPWTSSTSDLFLRILKHAKGLDEYKRGLELIYGFDVSNPDRMPLGFLERIQKGEDASAVLQQPFSTAALNTTIDVLGRHRKYSEMITAFEVLTKPLPTTDHPLTDSSSSENSVMVEDDEEDPSFYQFSPNPTNGPQWRPPHAKPNTQTYTYLIQHLAQSHHHLLVRHYLLEAIEQDRQSNATLKREIMTWADAEGGGVNTPAEPLPVISPVRCAVNHRMFLHAYGMANRWGHNELVRWLQTKIGEASKWKRADVEYYARFRELWDQRSEPSGSAAPGQLSEEREAHSADEFISAEDSENYQAPFRAMTGSPASNFYGVSSRPFALPVHLWLLSRDLTRFVGFNERLEEAQARMVQRTKEKIGRRVWDSKDIWLNSEGDLRKPDPVRGIIDAKMSGRVVITKEKWKEIVNFQKTRWTAETTRGPTPLREERRRIEGERVRKTRRGEMEERTRK